MTRWDCGFTYVAFSLAAEYILLLSIVSYFLTRLLWTLPSSKKLFLVLCVLHLVERILYFSLWPPLYQTSPDSPCAPGTSGEKDDPDSRVMNVFGTMPPCFFLSAFSINVFTFARIYHTVLGAHFTKFRVMTGLLTLANISVYALTITQVVAEKRWEDVSERTGLASVWSISATYMFVAIGFLTYSVLLYKGVTVRPREAVADAVQPYEIVKKKRRKHKESGWGGAGPTFGQQQLEEHEEVAERAVIQPVPSMNAPAAVNPMKKIVIVASICMVCFTLRSVVLPLIAVWSNGKFDWISLLFYFQFSEIIPLSLMLGVFELRSPSLEDEENKNRQMRYPGGEESDIDTGVGTLPYDSVHHDFMPGANGHIMNHSDASPYARLAGRPPEEQSLQRSQFSAHNNEPTSSSNAPYNANSPHQSALSEQLRLDRERERERRNRESQSQSQAYRAGAGGVLRSASGNLTANAGNLPSQGIPISGSGNNLNTGHYTSVGSPPETPSHVAGVVSPAPSSSSSVRRAAGHSSASSTASREQNAAVYSFGDRTFKPELLVLDDA